MSKLSIIPIDRNEPAGFGPFLSPCINKNDPELILGYAIGNTAAGILQSRVTDGYITVDRIYVAETFRKIGIGTRLLEDLKKRAKDAGINKICASFSYDMSEAKAVSISETFMYINGFEKTWDIPVMMFSLGDIIDGPAKPMEHAKSENCVSVKNVDDNIIRASMSILMQNMTLPPVSKDGHLRESMFYIENGRALGCMLLDPYPSGDNTIIISDLRSQNTAMLSSIINSTVQALSAHHPLTTTLYASPVDDAMKDFIMMITGNKAVSVSSVANYEMRFE